MTGAAPRTARPTTNATTAHNFVPSARITALSGKPWFAARGSRRPVSTTRSRTRVAVPGPSAAPPRSGRGPPARRDRHPPRYRRGDRGGRGARGQDDDVKRPGTATRTTLTTPGAASEGPRSGCRRSSTNAESMWPPSSPSRCTGSTPRTDRDRRELEAFSSAPAAATASEPASRRYRADDESGRGPRS